MRHSSLVAAAGRGVVVVAMVTGVGLTVSPAIATTPTSSTVTIAPSALSPDDSSGTPLKDTVLSWDWLPPTSTSCSDVPAYDGCEAPPVSFQVQISSDPSFSSTNIAFDTNSGANATPVQAINILTGHPGSVQAQFAVPATLPNGSYFWRTRGYDKNGLAGPWSANAQFTQGWSTTPTGLASSGPLMPTFTWSPVKDASAYEIEFSDSSTFPAPSPTSDLGSSSTCLTNHTSFTPLSMVNPTSAKTDLPSDCFGVSGSGSLVWGKTYYWRVRAEDGTYQSANSGPTAPAIACFGVSPEDQYPSSLPATAVSAPICGAWSAVQTVTLPAQPVDNSVITNPGNPAVNCASNQCTQTPTFSWSAVAGATDYRITIARDAYFTNILDVLDTTGTSLTPLDSLPNYSAGQGYHWTVQACSTTAGMCSTAPTAQTFTLTSPPVALVSPANGGYSAARYTTLTWCAYLDTGANCAPSGSLTDEAKAYVVDVSQSPTFSSLTDQAVVDCTGMVASECSYSSPSNQYPDGVVYWRVAGIDGSGNYLPWSATWSYTHDSVVPTASWSAASTSSLTAPIGISFSVPVTGVSSSTVTVTNAAGASVPGTITSTSSTAAQFAPAQALTAGQYYSLHVASSVTDAAGMPVEVLPGTVRAETSIASSSASFTYSWDHEVSASATGGGYSRSENAGDALAFHFSGTSASVVGVTANGGGYGEVYVDGVAKGVVSWYSTTPVWNKTLYSVTGLTAGLHTLAVKVLGTHPSGALGAWLYVVGFRNGSTFSSSTAAGVNAGWAQTPASDALGGSFKSTSASLTGHSGTLPSVSTTFAGSAVQINFCTGPNEGIANVYVDGASNPTTVVNLYATFASCGFKVQISSLATGVTHSLNVVAAGTKSPVASNTLIEFNGVTVQ